MSAAPIAELWWRRSGEGDWTRCLPDGPQLTVFRSRGRRYWSRCGSTTAHYSPAYGSEDEAFGAALEADRD